MACQADFTMSGREILRSDKSGLRMTRWLNKKSYIFQPPGGEVIKDYYLNENRHKLSSYLFVGITRASPVRTVSPF